MKNHDATFFMTLEEFHQAAFEIDYAFYHPGYTASSMAIPFTGSRVRAKLVFTMKDDSPFWYMVTWPTARLVSAKANCTHESLVMPEVRAFLNFWGSSGQVVTATNFTQKVIGHAWKSFPAKAGPGKYEIMIDVDFKKITWVPEVSVVLFAKEKVQFRFSGQPMDNGRQLNLSPKQVQTNEECAAFIERVKGLDNHASIQEKGYDDQFPPEMKSIADGDVKCEDPGQGISVSCKEYNHWTTLDNVACPSFPTTSRRSSTNS